MKFLLGGSTKTPRPDKSMIFKYKDNDKFSLVEVDYSRVADYLNVSEDRAKQLTKAVVYSIWRLEKWTIEE